MGLDQLLKKLKNNGYKVTQQRKAIVQILVLNKGKIISVEELLKQVKKIYSKTNLTTVYRNLEILEHIHLVHKVMNEEGKAYYHINELDSHHHHIICKGCGKTEVVEYCPIDYLSQVAKDKKIRLTEHKIELYGYCEECEKLNGLKEEDDKIH